MLRFIIAALVTGVSPVMATAGNESRVSAFALGDGRFEVIADFSENAIYWCGAAVFVSKAAGRASGARIYVVGPPAPSLTQPGETAVTFGLSAPAVAPVSGWTRSVDKVGTSMSLQQALQTCNERSASG